MAQHYEQGDYTARVKNQGFTESKEKRTPFFFLEIEPISAKGPNTLPDKIYTRTIKWFCTDATIDYTLEKVRQLGWEGKKLAELEPGSKNHHSFVDLEIEVTCQHDGDYENWDVPRGGVGIEAQAGLGAKLDKLFGKAVTATAPKTAKATKKQTESDAEPAGVGSDGIPEEEIPF